MFKTTAVYYLCFKCKKTIPSCSCTMKKELKDVYTYGIYKRVLKPSLEWCKNNLGISC